MKNKMIMLLLSGVLLVSLSGCNAGSSAFISGVTDKDIKEDIKDVRQETVKLYFSDSQAENLVEVTKEIALTKDDSLEMKIIDALQTESEDEELSNVIDRCITVKSIGIEDKLATVDVSSEKLEGSSTQEMFFIEGIVSALTQLEDIEKVKFTVDGEEKESLMGHMDATMTYTQEEVMSPIIKSEEK